MILCGYKETLQDILQKIGLGQRRCAHCLHPFFPSEIRTNTSTARLCPSCQLALAPFSGSRCHVCGLPAGLEASANEDHHDYRAHDSFAQTCQNCHKHPPEWQIAAFYGLYSGPLRDLILRLKFDAELHIAKLLADFLVQACACLPKPDIIMAIPQYPSHLRNRGFNQAHEIARYLAKATGLRLEPGILKRIRPGLPQEGLNAAERKANLRNAFKAAGDLSNKVIWLIDDVMTTGSTYREASRALLEAGAKKICALFVARTPI